MMPMFKKDMPPTWAGFFTLEQYALFLSTVIERLRGWGISAEIDDGMVLLPDDGQQMGLQNLAQICNRHDEDEWPDIIGEHFGRVLEVLKQGGNAIWREAPFASIRGQLALRLQPESLLESEAGEHLVYRYHLPGTVTMLVLDLPTTIASVTWEMVGNWGRSADDLFEIALENVRKMPEPTIDSIETGSGVDVITFVGDDFFVASNVLLLDKYPECIGAGGTLVIVPHRHTMMCYPIYDTEVVSAISTLLPTAYGMFNEGPGSISPNLYWYDGEAFIDLPYTVVDMQLNFEPPAPFVSLLEKLVEAN